MLAVLVLLALLPLGAVAAAAGPGPRTSSAPRSPYDLVHRCFRLVDPGGRQVVAQDGFYRAEKATGTPFFLQATGLGRYLLYDPRRQVLTSSDAPAQASDGPGPDSVWAPERISRWGLVLRHVASGRRLAVNSDGTLWASNGPGTRFAFVPARGCAAFPEAEVDAVGTPRGGRLRDGTVRGLVDAHLHITADLRAGGRTIYGSAFSPYGIADALGHDADEHGPRGALDVTGNLLREGTPVGTHDTDGWPTFTGWPTYDTNTHQQVYYRWLQRMWLAGLRITTAMLVEDQPLCRLEPFRNHSCDEGDTIALEARRMWALQDYVDAQEGGPGRGWLRIVTSPAQARRVVEQGKLAVVLGVESSNPFGCSQFRGRPACDRSEIDRGIARFRALGVRSVFLAHWVDNALGGAALEGGSKGQLIGAMNTEQTGEFFRTGRCPEAGQGEEVTPAAPVPLPLLGQGVPVYPPGKQCNTRGLTDLGRYAVARLIANHMLIEADHLSEVGRLQLLALAERARYPLVSSHTDTGGYWTVRDLRRLVAIGGFVTATISDAPHLAARALALRTAAGPSLRGIGLGTDTGGFADLPAPVPPTVARPLAYPFTSYDGRVLFTRQRTGSRVFDLNTDGVAHYGLLADELAQLRTVRGGASAAALLFGSAEAYLRTWARTGA
jgi:microsomal dipeptidase-like Zn-dependent dipeptidase